MSRKQNLIDITNGSNESWVTGLYIDNIPEPMLANEFIVSIAVVINSALLVTLNDSLHDLSKLEITNNR